MDTDNITYWLPSWWGWIDNWAQCRTCLRYNHSPCVSCEIPPGMLGLVQLVGGGTAAVAGNLRGNATIASHQQAVAASRMVRPRNVNIQLNKQNELIKKRLRRQSRNQY